MADYPLAALITGGAEGIEANHIPLLLDPEPQPDGTLLGHMARANTQWQGWTADTPALAIFRGPQAYISPNWYPSKHENGRAVPTWNYAVVHVHGTVSAFADSARLRAFLDRLTAVHEAGEPLPWRPADAPADYIDGLLNAIVGIELRITRIEGKWKTGQNQSAANKNGAAEALEALGNTRMSGLMR